MEYEKIKITLLAIIAFTLIFFTYSQHNVGRYSTFGMYNGALLDTKDGAVYVLDKNNEWRIEIPAYR